MCQNLDHKIRKLNMPELVHELVHLLAPNHGRVFKSFMHAYLPDWEERDQRLRKFTDRKVSFGIGKLG